MLNNYVAEYSISQNCFHIETVGNLVKEGLILSINKIKSDWIPIGFFKTELEAHDFIEKVRPKLQGYYKIKQK